MMIVDQFRDDFERLVARTKKRDGFFRSRYRGFSPDEVDEVERMLGHPLPPAYQAFLLVMGRCAGRDFEYVTLSFNGPGDLLEFQKDARRLIAEEDLARDIPTTAFFCSNYLDSQLSYFDMGLGEEDPRLFDFELGNPEPPASNFTLSSYIHFVLEPGGEM